LTGASEDQLMDAYERASGDGVTAVVLSFAGLEYMNSSGIGLLVTLLVRAHRRGQQVLAFGLSEHYRQIFELTRLDEAITIFDDESSALSSTITL
jgi:anti-sigma B factor antagonist